MEQDKLIYASAARKAILKEDPKLAYCIDEVPGVDAVEVVRCKDCKWYDADCEICVLHSEDGDTYDCGCDVNMKPDDFCSYGERREDNGKSPSAE